MEWPVMAFLGVSLGLLGRVALEQGLLGVATAGFDPELALPLLLKNILPAGLLGLMLSAYFSAVMSTADSCLMAASGNLLTDIIGLDRIRARVFERLVQVFRAAGGVFGIAHGAASRGKPKSTRFSPSLRNSARATRFHCASRSADKAET